MKKIFSMFIIIILFSLFSSQVFAEDIERLAGADPIEIVTTSANIPAYETNTDPTIANIAIQSEEVKSLISQWQAVFSMIKNGGFGLTLLFLTIIPLLLVSAMTLGVVIIIILRTITLFTPDNIDKKIDKIEDWITEYLVKIPITILSSLKKLKK